MTFYAVFPKPKKFYQVFRAIDKNKNIYF